MTAPPGRDGPANARAERVGGDLARTDGAFEEPALTATVEVIEDRTERSSPSVGFLRLRRLVLANRWSDGQVSRRYAYDVVDRDALDAVALVLYSVTEEGASEPLIRVALRTSLRPPIALRAARPLPVPDDRPSAWLWEIPAGLIEPSERGEAGLRGCASRECLEETGIAVAPEAFTRLGASMFMSPGVLAERLHVFAAQVKETDAGVPTEDGSPVEERAETRFVELSEALAACRDGRVCDMKTELGLRRLGERLVSERLVSERLVSERLVSERLASERLASDHAPSERAAPDVAEPRS